MLQERLRGLLQPIGAPLILAACILASYAWTLPFPFVNDDYIWVESARAVPGDTWWHAMLLPSALWRPHFLRPVVQVSFYLNQLFGDPTPISHHAVNLLVHAINVYLVFGLARALLRDVTPSLLVALIFLIQPAHVDAVTWVSGRTELIAAAFYLGALLLHLGDRTACAAVLFAFALLSKESAISFPAAAIAVDLLGPRRRWRGSSTLVYAAVLLAYLTLRWVTVTHYAVGVVAVESAARGDVVGAIGVVAKQLADAARWLLAPLPVGRGWALGIFSALAAACLWTAREPRTRRTAWFAVVWMAVTLSPFAGWFTFQARYTYLASVGFALLLISGGTALANSSRASPSARRALLAVALCWIVACVVKLQIGNDQLRRNGRQSDRIIAGITELVPHPRPHTVFVIDGLATLRVGGDPDVRSPVLVFGLPEAVKLRFRDRTLGVTFPTAAGAPVPARGPVIRLQWDPVADRFARTDVPPLPH